MARTTSPNVRATPTWVTCPPLAALTTIAPVPANTRANVPNSSAASFLITPPGSAQRPLDHVQGPSTMSDDLRQKNSQPGDEGLEPGQGVRVDAVADLGRVDGPADQSGLLEDLQMLRHGGLGGRLVGRDSGHDVAADARLAGQED